MAERLRGQGITVETHLPQDQGDAGLTLVAVADSVAGPDDRRRQQGDDRPSPATGIAPEPRFAPRACDVLIVPTQSGSLAEFGGGAIVVGTDGSSGATLA